jgi:hypothetical protein
VVDAAAEEERMAQMHRKCERLGRVSQDRHSSQMRDPH